MFLLALLPLELPRHLSCCHMLHIWHVYAAFMHAYALLIGSLCLALLLQLLRILAWHRLPCLGPLLVRLQEGVPESVVPHSTVMACSEFMISCTPWYSFVLLGGQWPANLHGMCESSGTWQGWALVQVCPSKAWCAGCELLWESHGWKV